MSGSAITRIFLRAPLIVLIALLLALTACSEGGAPQGEAYRIRGEIEGLGDATLYYIWTDESSPIGFGRDTVDAVDDRFEIRGRSAETMLLMVMPRIEALNRVLPDGRYMPPRPLQLFVYPGADIRIEGRIERDLTAFATDGGLNDDLTTLERVTLPLEHTLTELNYQRVIALQTGAVERADSLLPRLEEQAAELRSGQERFIQEHPASVVSAWLLDTALSTQLTFEELDTYWASLTEEVRSHPLAAPLQAKLEGQRATALGQTAPLFERTGVDGRPVRLADHRGRWVILDFWASWCGPCIQGIPEMKRYYEKYRDRLEIISIAVNDQPDEWRAAIQEHVLPWVHLNDDQGAVPMEVTRQYAIEALPTKIILDPEGRVAYKLVGESGEFYQELDRLLGEGR